MINKDFFQEENLATGRKHTDLMINSKAHKALRRMAREKAKTESAVINELIRRAAVQELFEKNSCDLGKSGEDREEWIEVLEGNGLWELYKAIFFEGMKDGLEYVPEKIKEFIGEAERDHRFMVEAEEEINELALTRAEIIGVLYAVFIDLKVR